MNDKRRRYILPLVLFFLLTYFLLSRFILRNLNQALLGIWVLTIPLLVVAGTFTFFYLQWRKEIKYLMDDLNTVDEISALITGDCQADELFKNAFSKIQERLPVLNSAALFLVDEDRQELKLVASVELSEEVVSSLKNVPLKVGEGVAGKVAKTGSSFFTDNMVEEPLVSLDRQPLLKKGGGSLYGAVPLRSKNKTIGVFSFSSRLKGYFNAHERTWLEAVGNQIGLAIERIKLHEAGLRREKEALALFRLSQATTSSLTIDMVVKVILDQVTEITQSHAVWIMLFDPDQQLLEVIAARGLSGEVALKSLALRPGQGILGEVFQTGKLVFVPDIRKDHRLVYRAETERSGITSMIGIPLIAKGKAIGVMGLYSPSLVEGDRILEDRLDFLSTIASQVAIAIDNTKLYQDLEQKVTELRNLQGQLIQAEKLSAIGELVSGVAHEINNPLTSVVGFTQLLLETAERPRDKEFLEKIFNEAMSCSEIIRNLLTFARRHRAEKSLNHVNHILRKALELKMYQLQTDGIEVVENLSEDIPPVWVDSHQIQQVFFNIINNAHQALLEKKKLQRGVFKLAITSEMKKDMVSISFHDTGPGVIPDVLPKIFEPFFTTKEVGVGTGLGLSISYGIIKEHGGEILVENQFGQGATFIVSLPLHGKDRESGQVQGKDPSLKGFTVSSLFVGKKILIVDASTSILEMCAYILRSEGFRVEGLEKGRMVLERLREETYDLILIDFKMSDMEGPTFYNAILNEYPAMSDKIIFSMSDDPDLEMQRFLIEKKLEVLAKPFSVVALKEAIYRCLTASLNA